MKAFTFGGAMTIQGVLSSISRHLIMYSLPSLPDGTDPSEGDFISKNLFAVVVGLTFYQVLTALMDKMDKKKNDDLERFKIQHYPLFFSMVVSVVFFLQDARKKSFIQNPVKKAIMQGVWHLVIFFESIISIPIKNDRADAFEFEIDRDQIDSESYEEETEEDENHDPEKPENEPQNLENTQLITNEPPKEVNDLLSVN